MNVFHRLLVAASAAALFALSPAFAAANSNPVVNAPAGMVQGISQGALHVFKGIPYAEPPIGSMRWKAPVAKAHWTGVFEASRISARPATKSKARSRASIPNCRCR